ncbi:hypothetical protein KR059_005926 [Drosophila kikkawai]|nr:hypothetical protein KR059_005926 [Drosophila kikkawai]
MIYSTSVMSMVELLDLEESLKENAEIYVREMQAKLDIIKLFIDSTKMEPKLTTLEEKEEYMANPLNAFPLLRRLNQDWPKWLKYMKIAIAPNNTKAMQKHLKSAPSHDDLNVALKGMTRIEQFYNQQAEDLTKGFLLDKKFNSFLTSPDCISLADFHYNQSRFTDSTHWYRMALRLHKNPQGKLYERVLGLNRKKIYKKYAQAMLKESITLDKGKPTAAERAQWDALAKQIVKKDNYHNIKSLIDEYLTGDEKIFQEEAARHKRKPTNLELGCRGKWPKRISSELVCRYNRDTSAFLKLAPLKLEFLNMKPLILLYHDVLYDKEFKAMRDIAIFNATMTDGWTYVNFDRKGKPQRQDRVVKMISFQGTTASFTLAINRRIGDMTGLEMQENMGLHLTNYGLGGHFGKHLDYVDLAKRPANFSDLGGDRLATALLYATDVPLGGTTVFTKLKIAVKPKKGNALIWFNLDHAGNPEPLSEHSACPVVKGSRWSKFYKYKFLKFIKNLTILTAISKWIQERQQMFKKPCLALA